MSGGSKHVSRGVPWSDEELAAVRSHYHRGPAWVVAYLRRRGHPRTAKAVSSVASKLGVAQAQGARWCDIPMTGEHNGTRVTMTMREWAHALGIPLRTLRARKCSGWPDADVLQAPVRGRGKPREAKRAVRGGSAEVLEARRASLEHRWGEPLWQILASYVWDDTESMIPSQLRVRAADARAWLVAQGMSVEQAGEEYGRRLRAGTLESLGDPAWVRRASRGEDDGSEAHE